MAFYLFLVIAMGPFLVGCSTNDDRFLVNSKLIHDDKWHFSVKIPPGWKSAIVEGKGSLRLVASDSNSQKQMYVHVIKIRGQVDVEKLPDITKDIYRNIGQLVDTINRPYGSPWRKL